MLTQKPGTRVECLKCDGRNMKGGRISHQEGVVLAGDAQQRLLLGRQYLSYSLKHELASDRGRPSRKPNTQKT